MEGYFSHANDIPPQEPPLHASSSLISRKRISSIWPGNFFVIFQRTSKKCEAIAPFIKYSLFVPRLA